MLCVLNKFSYQISCFAVLNKNVSVLLFTVYTNYLQTYTFLTYSLFYYYYHFLYFFIYLNLPVRYKPDAAAYSFLVCDDGGPPLLDNTAPEQRNI